MQVSGSTATFNPENVKFKDMKEELSKTEPVSLVEKTNAAVNFTTSHTPELNFTKQIEAKVSFNPSAKYYGR